MSGLTGYNFRRERNEAKVQGGRSTYFKFCLKGFEKTEARAQGTLSYRERLASRSRTVAWAFKQEKLAVKKKVANWRREK